MMRAAVLCAAVLAGCGPAEPVDLGVWPFRYYQSDAAVAAADAQRDADRALAILVRVGLVARGAEAAFAGDAGVKRHDVAALRADGSRGLYFPSDTVIVLNASGESLLHELLHHYEAKALDGADAAHTHWDARGWWELSAEFKAEVSTAPENGQRLARIPD